MDIVEDALEILVPLASMYGPKDSGTRGVQSNVHGHDFTEIGCKGANPLLCRHLP